MEKLLKCFTPVCFECNFLTLLHYILSTYRAALLHATFQALLPAVIQPNFALCWLSRGHQLSSGCLTTLRWIYSFIYTLYTTLFRREWGIQSVFACNAVSLFGFYSKISKLLLRRKFATFKAGSRTFHGKVCGSKTKEKMQWSGKECRWCAYKSFLLSNVVYLLPWS